MNSKTILVTGATGYVGGRLVPHLLAAGYRLKAMARSLAKLKSRPWALDPRVQLVAGNLQDTESLKCALTGCHAAFYLIQDIHSQKSVLPGTIRLAARNMAVAAAEARLERMIYLSELGTEKDIQRVRHLGTGDTVAHILQSGSVPVTVLSAAFILGSGSASFEMLRYLVDRMPVMLLPRWGKQKCQPIAIRNVLNYLTGCLEQEQTTGKTFDIGGPDVLTFRELMETYAEEAGLPKRMIIPVPFIPTALSAYWIHLISPVPTAVTGPLTRGFYNPLVCADQGLIRSLIPQELLTCREAIRLALERIQQKRIETRWSDAGSLRSPEWTHGGDATYAGGTILECGYRVHLKATPEEIWQTVCRIGGDTGWYFGNVLWRIRGGLDRLIGGSGLRRGRRHPSQLLVGDCLDFWRVLEVKPQRYLLLLAEMKMPGEGLMEIRITTLDHEMSEVQMFSRFLPKGISGILYWYVLYPFHQWVYRGILKSVAKSIKKPITFGPKRFTSKLPGPHA